MKIEIALLNVVFFFCFSFVCLFFFVLARNTVMYCGIILVGCVCMRCWHSNCLSLNMHTESLLLTVMGLMLSC